MISRTTKKACPTKLQRSGGFIALISALIIAVVLLLVISSANLSGFYSRSNILDSELKERSSALAEACVDEALLQLANDSTYTGSPTTPILVGTDPCYVDSVINSPPNKIIKTHATYNNLHTNLEVTVDTTHDLAVVSWEETPN